MGYGTLVRTVDRFEYPRINFVNLSAQRFGIYVQALSFAFRQKVVERGIEYTNNLGTLVVHDRLVLFVPQNRDGESTTWFVYINPRVITGTHLAS